MANIPGISGYTQPGVFSRVRTIRRAVSIPGGLRILAIVGLGKAEETIILNAEGSGADGVNPDYTGASAPDGRHFVLSKADLVSRRTELYKNGVLLSGVEQTIDTNPFNDKYDYRLEPLTGRIELQRAFLVDQGGMYAPPSSANNGNGTVTVSLIDTNAPSETWTLRATSIIRDSFGDPISGLTTFTAVGSVSGQPVDAYGAPVSFVSDGYIRNNGILSLTITEGTVPFDRGDRFTVKVSSGVLSKGDLLEARYIANQDLYDPQYFTDANALFAKHGFVSEENTLSLGALMAFENGAPGVYAMQAMPTVPRRTSEVVLARDNPLTSGTEGFPTITGPVTSSDKDAFMYPLELGVPDSDTEVHIFIINRADGSETQIFPTKHTFYDTSITSDPFNNFIDGPNYNYGYTVVLEGQVEDEGVDGVIVSGHNTFRAASADFSRYNIDLGESDLNKQIKILHRDVFGNIITESGSYNITAVGDGYGDFTVVTLSGFNPTHSYTNIQWQLVDSADKSAYVLLTDDLYTSGTIKARDGIRVSYVDANDAPFFDTNWQQAFAALEQIECQIVVPLPDATYSAVQQAAVAHCELMSNTANQRERVALIGAQMGVTSDALLGRELVAVEDVGILEGIQGSTPEDILSGNIEDLQNFNVSVNWGNTFRAIYFWPDTIIVPINGSNTNIHGFYVGSAAGGWLSATANPAIPLTRKVLTGFTISRSYLRRPTILNALGNNGVSVLQPVVGGGQILHCKTTTNSGDPLEEEPSVVFIRDKVAQSLRDVLRGFIGNAEDPTLISSISSKVQKTVQGLIGQGLLTNSRNLSVSRDEVDPRQWNVTIEVQPSLPVNWIFVDVSVGIF